MGHTIPSAPLANDPKVILTVFQLVRPGCQSFALFWLYAPILHRFQTLVARSDPPYHIPMIAKLETWSDHALT